MPDTGFDFVIALNAQTIADVLHVPHRHNARNDAVLAPPLTFGQGVQNVGEAPSEASCYWLVR